MTAQPDPFLFHDIQAFCSAFRHRQDALILMKQLIQLIQSVQRHRGFSMALLAGSGGFQADFEQVQAQLNKRLMLFQAFAAQANGCIHEREMANVQHAWLTICVDWQQDAVIDNFELHSFFIQQLQGLLGQLAKHIEQPVSAVFIGADKMALPQSVPQSATEQDYPQAFKQIELLDFIANQLPSMIEQVGRIRGLATYALAKGECEGIAARKLRYEIGVVRAQQDRLRHQAQRLEVLLGRAISSLPFIKTYELKLMFLLSLVEEGLLADTPAAPNSYQVFKLASEIIDTYIRVVQDGLAVLSVWHEADLETPVLAESSV